jgi:hypothetical protein
MSDNRRRKYKGAEGWNACWGGGGGCGVAWVHNAVDEIILKWMMAEEANEKKEGEGRVRMAVGIR